MRIIDIIAKKKDKKELSKEEIDFFISGYTNGEIKDYQAAALIMAIYLNDMTDQELTNMTIAMANSGEMMDLSDIKGKIVDKHSTGGVGDKVSLILLPLVSSLGIKVAKMSGRGLGFTGGTADKLESIPGYNTSIKMDDFKSNIEDIGISMITQTLNLAPADKKIYELRNSISCVENISLIASSIMSKKIASGAEKIILDVTVGNGAFMKNLKEAEQLSKKMIEIGKLAKRETICILTNMNEPLGTTVGNSLEVIEAVEFLKGNMQEDLKAVIFELGAHMLKLADLGNNIEENKKELLRNILNGRALAKFIELIEKQGGDSSYILDTTKFPKASHIVEIESEQDGYIINIISNEIGRIANILGAGRSKKEDIIDNSAGIKLNVKVGQKVQKGEIIGYLYTNKENVIEEMKKECIKSIQIDKEEQKIDKRDHILKVMN